MVQEYWAAHDESGEYPHELHKSLAKDGWIGIALPEKLGGSGLGISEATMMLHTISEWDSPPKVFPETKSKKYNRSGAGMAGAQSIHASKR